MVVRRRKNIKKSGLPVRLPIVNVIRKVLPVKNGITLLSFLLDNKYFFLTVSSLLLSLFSMSVCRINKIAARSVKKARSAQSASFTFEVKMTHNSRMLSRNYYGQKKRRREDEKFEPLRLTGGGGRGRRVARLVNPGAYAFDDDKSGTRTTIHNRWNEARGLQHLHFDIGRIKPVPMGQLGMNVLPVPKIVAWDLADQDRIEGRMGPPPHYREVKQLELDILWAAGTYLEDQVYHGNNPYDALNINTGQYEPGWQFLGMADSKQFGGAWSVFYYSLSDLYAGGNITGSQLVRCIREICGDIGSIIEPEMDTAFPEGDWDPKCYFHFEGKTDSDSAQRHYIRCNKFYGLRSMVENDTYLETLLDQIAHFFTSDDNKGFVLYRVYVHVMTGMFVGASLKFMPKKMHEMRDGKWFKAIKGFYAIPDTEDASCGLDAIVWSLANTCIRIKKQCVAAGKTVPELVKKFQNYRKRVVKNTTSGMLLKTSTKAELASFIGWRSGTPISEDEICHMVSSYASKYSLDIGVIIFDALNPLSKYTKNYDESPPLEVLCLIHWQYNGEAPQVSSGHYDCINPSNVTRWLQIRNVGGVRKDVRFSYKRCTLIPSCEADDKGSYCPYCKHWQKHISNEIWNSLHGGVQFKNVYECNDCFVMFKSVQCYELHKKLAHGSGIIACTSNKLCLKCGTVHVTTYQCDIFFCQICYKKCPITEKKDHACFLSHISDKKSARQFNVVYSDMEGSRAVEGYAGIHRAICIASSWTSLCEMHHERREEKKVLQDNKKCTDCLLNTDNWGPFCDACLADNELELYNDCGPCSEVHIKYFEGLDCLSQYMEWVMHTFLGGTVVFHNGGKYDAQLLMDEILTSGVYTLGNKAMRGNQIIFFTAGFVDAELKKNKKVVRFIDSCNFIQSSLRSFPSMFDIQGGGKGRFPYDMLNLDKWREYRGVCPPAKVFGVTDKELAGIENLADSRKKEVSEILDYIKEWNTTEKEWVALDILKEYTIQDTLVLRAGCEIFRENFWKLVHTDPFQWVTLASAVAGSYRQPQYMPSESIQIFSNADREWQRLGLRGGRCEPFKLYWQDLGGTERFKWYDVNSEYPAVQAMGYYPFGKVTVDLKYTTPQPWDKVALEFKKKTGIDLSIVLHDPSGKSGCGIIECNVTSANDTNIPVLPAKIKTSGGYVKNVFQNRTGPWHGFITLLASAVADNQVIVQTITRIQFWGITSNTIFRKFICDLYAAKVESSGWSKILNKKEGEITEEEKDEFIRVCKSMGIVIDAKSIKDCPGMRSTAKLMCNCGWGYLCQKPHADEDLFFDNADAESVYGMGQLISNLETDKDPRRLVGHPTQVGQFTRFKTTKKASDITVKEMNKKIAYQAGGQVPAYGCQKVTDALLSLHHTQPAYTDTDSIGFVIDSKLEEEGTHKDIKTGNYLGDWMDEYPDKKITEFCSLGCKTYFMRIESLDGKQVRYKGRFKGIPLTSASYSLLTKSGELAKLGMEEMKKMLFEAVTLNALDIDAEDVNTLTYQFRYSNFFKRNRDFKIRAVEEKKTVRFTFDKRNIVVPELFHSEDREKLVKNLHEVNTTPLNDYLSQYNEEDIQQWWNTKITGVFFINK